MATGGCLGRGHPNLLRSLPKMLLQDKPPEATVSQRRPQSPRLYNRKRPQPMTIPQEGNRAHNHPTGGAHGGHEHPSHRSLWNPQPSHRKRWDHGAHKAHDGPSQTDNCLRLSHRPRHPTAFSCSHSLSQCSSCYHCCSCASGAARR